MPRNGSGTYTLAQAAFVPATTISSAAVNSDFSDIATALTGSVAADGQTTLTGPIKFASGSAALPSLTFTAETTTGMYFISTGKIGLSAAGVAKVVVDGNKTGVGLDGNILYYFNGAILNPVGQITDFGGSTAPSGWLLCDGSAILRLSYPELFFIIATNFGSGNGSTTFNIPDLRGRVTVGRDDMGGSAASRITNAVSGITGTTLGASGGAQSVTITQATSPSHTHTMNFTSGVEQQTISCSVSGTTAGSSGSGYNLDHTHTQDTHAALGGVTGGGGAVNDTGLTGTNNTGGSSLGVMDHAHNFSGSGNITSNHNHNISGSTSSIGSDGAHINVQPSLIVNKIIFAGRP